MADLVKVVTPPFRASFVNVFRARAFEAGQEPKFGLTAIWTPASFTDQDKKRWAQLKAILDKAAMDKFKKPVKDLPANFKRALRDGVEKEDLEGFGAGKVFASITTKQQPGLIDVHKQPLLSETDFYPGVWARATVTAYGYDNVGKGIALGLHNLQKLKDDTRLDGRAAAEDDFDDDLDADAWGGEEVGSSGEGESLLD